MCALKYGYFGHLLARLGRDWERQRDNIILRGTSRKLPDDRMKPH